jgi:hypothetical protein
MKKIIICLLISYPLILFGQERVFVLKFNPDPEMDKIHEHFALMRKVNGKLLMRVKFYSQSCKCVEIIEQSVIRESSSKGKRLSCYDPVYANTNTPHVGYIPDTFYFMDDKVINIDDSGNEVEVSIMKEVDLTNALLLDFKWRKNIYATSND